MAIATGLAAPFVSLDTPLAMKREATRPQDLPDIIALEAARKLRETGNHDQG